MTEPVCTVQRYNPLLDAMRNRGFLAPGQEPTNEHCELVANKVFPTDSTLRSRLCFQMKQTIEGKQLDEWAAEQLTAILRVDRQTLLTPEEVIVPVIPEQYLPAILSGLLRPTGQVVTVPEGQMRFTLTSKNFCRLEGQLTRQEARDTARLIDELLRRLTIFAQMPEPARLELYKIIGAERLDRYRTLWMAIGRFSGNQAAQRMRDLRDLLDRG